MNKVLNCYIKGNLENGGSSSKENIYSPSGGDSTGGPRSLRYLITESSTVGIFLDVKS